MSSLTLADEPLVLKSYDDAYRAMKEYNVPGIFVFHATWCGPCQQMKRDVWEPLLPRLKDKYIVYFVDIDVEHEAARKLRTNMKVPSYAITTNGATGWVAYGEGYKDRAAFLRWMNVSIDAWREKQ
jgi:thiol-disulfide isomerase/thioredoxin